MNAGSDRRTGSGGGTGSDGLTSELASTIEGPLHLLATYDRDTFTTVHVGETVDREGPTMDLHSYLRLDFLEHEFLTECLFPDTSRVEAETLTLDTRQVLTAYQGDEAVLAIVDNDEPIEPVLRAVRATAWEEEPWL